MIVTFKQTQTFTWRRGMLVFSVCLTEWNQRIEEEKYCGGGETGQDQYQRVCLCTLPLFVNDDTN